MSLGDALIAATALEHGLTLMTRNVRDFAQIPGLMLAQAFKRDFGVSPAPTAVRVSNARSSSSGKRPSPERKEVSKFQLLYRLNVILSRRRIRDSDADHFEMHF